MVQVMGLPSGLTGFPALMMDRLHNDPDPLVRVVAMCLLARKMDTEPSDAGLLQDRIEQDVDRAVRCAAIAYWAGDRSIVGPYGFIAHYQSGYREWPIEFALSIMRAHLGAEFPLFEDVTVTFDRMRPAVWLLSRDHSTITERLPSPDDAIATTLPLLLNRAVSDEDHVVRAVALLYASALAPKDPAVGTCLSARQRDEPHERLRTYLSEFARFAALLPLRDLLGPPDFAAT